MLAYGILIIGALASFYCYTKLAALLPMRDESAVTHADAQITSVQTPMVKKGQSVSDVTSQITFRFQVGERDYLGGYSVRHPQAVPEVGAAEPVVYVTRQPSIFLRAEEYKTLPRQLAALRWMIGIFAVIALFLPFVVLGTGRR